MPTDHLPFYFYNFFRPFPVRLWPNQQAAEVFEDEVAVFANIARRISRIRIDPNRVLPFGAAPFNISAIDRMSLVTWIVFFSGCSHKKLMNSLFSLSTDNTFANSGVSTT